jgi:isoquinoline 1-oxidoreductase alpha subunit
MTSGLLDLLHADSGLPMMRPQEAVMVRLAVNGVDHTFDGDLDMPLLWFVRDALRLTGTKFGCGMALCGACTVHQDGKPVRSCSIAMGELHGARITTIEGLGAELHPVQQAWIERRVPQCGYCQSGQIMSAVALLQDHPKPSDEQIDDAMQGNICRCGTYERIREAIKVAAERRR